MHSWNSTGPRGSGLPACAARPGQSWRLTLVAGTGHMPSPTSSFSSKRRCLRALDPSNPSTSPSPSCGHPSDGSQTIPSASLSSLYTACAKLCSNARADNLGVPCHDGCHFKCRPLCLQCSSMDLPQAGLLSVYLASWALPGSADPLRLWLKCPAQAWTGRSGVRFPRRDAPKSQPGHQGE